MLKSKSGTPFCRRRNIFNEKFTTSRKGLVAMFLLRKIKIYCSGSLESLTLAKKITTFHNLCFVKLVIFVKALEFLYAFITVGIRHTNLNVSKIRSFQPVSFQKQGN
jgi:hypothetical protein